VDLPVGNARGDVVVAYAIKCFPISGCIKLQRSRTPYANFFLWVCKWGIQEGMQ